MDVFRSVWLVEGKTELQKGPFSIELRSEDLTILQIQITVQHCQRSKYGRTVMLNRCYSLRSIYDE